LRGKHKPNFRYYQDVGDKVRIINADKLIVTGHKAKDKIYYRHSQYPGGLKAQTFEDLFKKNPEQVIRLAIKNMLPDNRLRRRWLNRLEIERSND